MTVGVLIRVILRWWAVAALGLVLTAAACTVLSKADRTYGASVDLVFVQPGEGSVVSVSDAVVPSLIDFAGLVQRRVSHQGSPVELPSSTATLYGSGVKSGYSVTLPNSGTQWAVSYTRPVLAVQVVGASPDQVRQTLDGVMNLVESEAHDLQTARGIAGNDLIYVKRSPAIPEIVDLGSTNLGRMKGILVLSVLGLGITAFAALGIDRMVSKLKLSRVAREVNRA